jgi:Sec7-like guanine-nucleotide exchange factor
MSQKTIEKLAEFMYNTEGKYNKNVYIDLLNELNEKNKKIKYIKQIRLNDFFRKILK